MTSEGILITRTLIRMILNILDTEPRSTEGSSDSECLCPHSHNFLDFLSETHILLERI